MGLKMLAGEMGGLRHLPWLLERPDFLSPENPGPVPRLTEYGLFGLGLCRMLARRPASVSWEEDQQGTEQQTLWRLEQQMATRFGKRWRTSEPWASAMDQASATLMDTKATSQALRDGICASWLAQVQASHLTLRATSELDTWMRRLVFQAHVRLDADEKWAGVIDALDSPARLAFHLRRLADSIETARRKNRKLTLSEALTAYDYDIHRAWTKVEEALRTDGPVLPPPGDPLHAPAMALLQDLAASGTVEMGKAAALLLRQALEERLPTTVAPRAQPRM